MVYTCCVSSCRQRTGIMHTFPRAFPQVYDEWLRRVQRNDFFTMDPKKVARNYRICDRHFSAFAKVGEQCRSKRAGLKPYALPTENLPGFQEPSTIKNSLWSSKEACEELPGEVVLEVTINPHVEVSLGNDFQEPGIPGPSSSLQLMQTPTKRKASLRDQDVQKSPKQPRFDIKRRRHFVRIVNVKRSSQLSPQAQKFYKAARDLKTISRELDSENANVKMRLKAAKDFCASERYLRTKVDKVTYNFYKSQIEQQSVPTKGRHFTLEDKLHALRILKQSPKCYRLLQKIFDLPSEGTISKLLSKIPFEDGINKKVIKLLKCSVRKLSSINRKCIIMFGEMSIEANLFYCAAEDRVEGFTTADGRNIADHVMVFMAAGISRQWKQPIGYFFTKNGMSAPDIALYLKTFVKELQNIGLSVVATVCDQLSTNSAAYERLHEETKQFCLKNGTNVPLGFLSNEEEVVTIFDVPHLLVDMRNYFLEGDIEYVQDEKSKTAKWQDVIDFYKADDDDVDFKVCQRLTDSHVYKDKIKSMKVKYAAQVFSQRLSAAMRAFGKFGIFCLQNSAGDTADFLLLMDNLFDSCNSSSKNAPHYKLMKSAVQKSSSHIEFWNSSLKILESVKFSNEKRKDYVPPIIKNWVLTLKGFIQIWKNLEKKRFKYLCTRHLNQDALEKFFGIIKSHGGRNINPTAFNFKGSFKTLMISNFSASSSPWTNCNSKQPIEEIIDCDEFVLSPRDDNLQIKAGLHKYISGYVAKRILKKVKNCENCKEQLTTSNRSEARLWIKARTIAPKSLIFPTAKFYNMLVDSLNVLKYFTPKFINKNNLRFLLIREITKHVSANLICEKHNLFDLFNEFIVKFYIRAYVNNVNKHLKSVTHKNTANRLKILALNKYKKNKKIIATRKKKFNP